MFLKAINDSFDFTSLVTFGTDFTVSSLADLVAKVAARAKARELQELILYAHGGNGSFSLGDDTFGGISSPADAQARLDRLAKLAPLFGGSNGRPRLILCVCEAGRNPANLLAMAKAINQPVYGCKADVRPLLGWEHGWWRGEIVQAMPGASEATTVPAIPDPPILLD